jgi:hypothetical protein
MPRSLRFETDWLAVDARGHVALFRGGTTGALPLAAQPERTEEALEALMRADDARRMGFGYRDAGGQANEPIFDPPVSSDGGPLHERATVDYPHFVVAEDGVKLHDVLCDVALREVIVSRGAGVVATAVGEFTWEMLHESPNGICIGCRATFDLDDLPPRAPALVARAGLFVYAHDGVGEHAPYVRVVSPSVPADLADLEPVVAKLAGNVSFAIDFAERELWSPSRAVDCR